MWARRAVLALAVPGVAQAAPAHAPESYLQTFGPAANPITSLLGFLAWVSVLVTVVMTALVLWGALARGRRFDVAMTDVPVQPRGSGLRWLWIGVAVTAVLLLASIIWTVQALNTVAYPGRPSDLTIEITGEQWWWKADYVSDDPRQTFMTANEIHIPVGRPVRLRIKSDDVIHSFWVPALAGKTDAIPGRTNLMWLQADRPGRYRGECQEYCGLQHAHMAFSVVAESPQQFAQWRANQLRDAVAPAGPEQAEGQRTVVFKCGACHTVRGTDAGGATGPDLTHLMSRASIAAGAAPNTPGALSGWIGNPQGVKPGTLMPTLYLSGPELTAVRSYLLTLQ